MKYRAGGGQDRLPKSLSLRRAWIEIPRLNTYSPLCFGRSPYGERGLKFDDADLSRDARQSLSLRRAWIEIGTRTPSQGERGSLSLRRAWIEITCPARTPHPPRSLSLRRAWIEIRVQPGTERDERSRSPYGERGLKFNLLTPNWVCIVVALLTESVD